MAVTDHVGGEYGGEAVLHLRSSLAAEISEPQWKNICAERILGMSGCGYELTLRRDPASVRLWLPADIRREPAECPLLTLCGHSTWRGSMSANDP